MTLQEVWSLLNLYNSSFSGEQIDEAIGVILNGGISAAVDAAQASAEAAAKSASEAAGSAASVGAAATNAQSAASRASGSATEAESYAHGGTGTREGEDEDNARYYSEEAAAAAAAAAGSADSVAEDSAAAVAAASAATAAAQNAGNSAVAAEDSAAAAKAAADSIAGSVDAAAASASAAKTSESNAQSAASRASGSATEAESYAHGGTETREGEDEDNARYYSEEAAAAAAAAAGSADSVAEDSAAAVAAASAATAAAQNAGNSAVAAEDSAAAAKAAADSIAGSVDAAAASASAAKTSESNANASKTAAAASAAEAKKSETNAAKFSEDAAKDAAAAVQESLAGYVSDAEAAKMSAESAQAAAEKARDEAREIVGGDFATDTEAKDYAATAEANAVKYTDQHINNSENPHNVTKEQVGLGSVPNVATNDQTPTYTAASAPAALTSGEKLSTAFGKIAAAISALITHLADSVRHVTAAERSAWNAKSNFSGSYNDLTNKPTIPAVPTKVSAFENDAKYLTSYTETDPTVPAWAKAESKPSYTASEVGAIPASQKGAAGGVASLGSDGKVPTGQLPATMTPAAHAASHKTGGSDALSPADIGAAAKATIVTATLAANGWADGAYILTVDGVTATSNQEILPAVDITAEQLEALQAANIQDGGQTAGNITLKAYGDVPTIDIPIRVIKRGD